MTQVNSAPIQFNPQINDSWALCCWNVLATYVIITLISKKKPLVGLWAFPRVCKNVLVAIGYNVAQSERHVKQFDAAITVVNSAKKFSKTIPGSAEPCIPDRGLHGEVTHPLSKYLWMTNQEESGRSRPFHKMLQGTARVAE